MDAPAESKPPGESMIIERHDAEYQEFLRLEHEMGSDRARKLTRKIDWHVLPQLILVYCLTYIDRGNVGNARLFGAQTDNHLSDADWDTGLTLLFVTYALAAIPSNILVKRFGPQLVLPMLTMCVGVIVIGTGCSGSRAQWFSLRLVLGIFEAGIYPGCTFTLTTWYAPSQIHSRTTLFYLGGVLSGAFSGLLAYGIGQLDYTWGYRGWRWIYVLEGLTTTLAGFIIIFFFQHDPSKQRRWLSQEERQYLVLRSKYQYGGGRAGSKNDFTFSDFFRACRSWHVWIIGFSFISCTLSIYGLSLTLPTIIKNMGFTASQAQALSCPPYVFAAFCVVASGYYSDIYRKRMLSCVIPATVGFVGLLIAVLTVKHSHLVALSYVGVCLGAGGLYCLTPGLTVWVGLNTAGQTKRAAAIAIVVFAANLGGIPGSNIYLAQQAPGYPTGYGCSLAFTGLGCILTPIIYAFILSRVNKKRDAMDENEVQSSFTVDELEAMGDMSPLYRYEL